VRRILAEERKEEMKPLNKMDELLLAMEKDFLEYIHYRVEQNSPGKGDKAIEEIQKHGRKRAAELRSTYLHEPHSSKASAEAQNQHPPQCPDEA
jgi:hypothetical protein